MQDTDHLSNVPEIALTADEIALRKKRVTRANTISKFIARMRYRTQIITQIFSIFSTLSKLHISMFKSELSSFSTQYNREISNKPSMMPYNIKI